MKVSTGVMIRLNHRSWIWLVFVPCSVSHFLGIFGFCHFSRVLYQTFDLISNNSSYIVRLDMGRAHIARRRYLNGLVWLVASLPFGQSTHITNPTFERLPTLLDGLKAVFVAWLD